MSQLIRGTTEGNQIRLAYLDTGGSGFPVMFLHGAMGRAACWQHVMQALSPRYRCIAIDQRGHGRSDKPTTGYDRDSYIADMERAFEALGLARFALIGHSTGAVNAWVYAARHPEQVAALVIEDKHASRREKNVQEWHDWLGSWPLPFPTLAAVREYFASIRPSLGNYFVELFEEREDGWRPVFEQDAIFETIACNEVRDWWDELSEVRCPTLVVKGSDSELPLDEAKRMAEVLPHGQLAVIDGAAHTIHVDQPAAYIHTIGEFLDGTLVHDKVANEPPFSDLRLEVMARAQYERGDAGFPIDPHKTALLMIDMQEEYVTEFGGPYRVPQAGRRAPQMAALLTACRERGIPVIHTAFAATHHFLDRPKHGYCMPNRASESGFDDSQLFQKAKFIPELRPLDSEIVILKPSYGAFFDTPLETILKRLNVETVILAGILTDCCVGTTARQAYERGFGAVVVSDATATALSEMHEAELNILRRSFARVLTTDQVLTQMDRADTCRISQPTGEKFDTVSP